MSMPYLTTTTASSSTPAMEQYQGQFCDASSIDFFNNALDLSLTPTSPSDTNNIKTGLTPPLLGPNVSPTPSTANAADQDESNNKDTETILGAIYFASRTAHHAHARTESAPSPSQLLEQIHGGQFSKEQSPAAGMSIAPSALHGPSQETNETTPFDAQHQADFQTFFQDLNGAVPHYMPPPADNASYMTQQAFAAAQGYPLYAAGSYNVLTTETVAPNGVTWGFQTTSYTVPNLPSTTFGVPHLSPLVSPGNFQPRQMPANLASPAPTHRSTRSPQLSTPSPRISRHGRMLSTSSMLSVNGSLSAPSPSVMLRSASSTGGTGSDGEDHEESGSSAYSPWSVHGRHLSGCEGLSPLNPHQHLACTSVPAPSSSKSRADKTDAMTVEQWVITELGPGASSYAMSSPAGPEQPKKRKRLSRAVPVPAPQVEESVWKGDEEEDGASSEDEFTWREEEGTDSDADFEEKAKKRSAKKRRVSVSASSPSSSHSHSHHGHGRSGMGLAAPNYGQEVKVHTLIPIDRKDKSCPHCGFVPSNGRFSDLKRHHQKHLIDGCAGKEMWVCTLCGDIEAHDVQSGKWRVYIPYTNMVGKIVKYTRKDSAKRHWQKEHGDRGIVFLPGHLAIVDDVREESS